MLAFTNSMRRRTVVVGTLRIRLYHAKEGKMDALKRALVIHTDSIFKRHNMKSIGYWSPEDTPDSQNLFIYILEHPTGRKRRKLGCFPSRSGMAEGEGRSEANGPLVDHNRPLLHGRTSFSALQ